MNVNVPTTVWARMVNVAEARGVKVEDILVAAIVEVTKPRNRKERVLELVRAGLPDAVVAERTGELKNYVGDTRRKAHLAPNRQPRTNTETPTKENKK